MKTQNPVLMKRFMGLVMPEPNSGCWLWMGTISPQGYGYFYIGAGASSRAHRFSYEAAKGVIPAGLALDHICRVRCCVNPDHLEAVTNKTNVLRGVGPTAVNAVKTHCEQGHPLAGQNIGSYNGWRICRKCAADRQRVWIKAKRAKVRAEKGARTK